MTKNVVILHASPRQDGNSHTLAEVFSAGAEAAGHRVQRFNIGKANISGCLACDYCRVNDHRCLMDDDMQDIYPAIFTADCVVFATPLYFFGFPAQLKAVIDRLYAYGPEYFQKESVLLMVAEDRQINIFDAAKKNYEMAMLEYLGWADRGILLVPGVNIPGDIENNRALMDAYKLGFNL